MIVRGNCGGKLHSIHVHSSESLHRTVLDSCTTDPRQHGEIVYQSGVRGGRDTSELVAFPPYFDVKLVCKNSPTTYHKRSNTHSVRN